MTRAVTASLRLLLALLAAAAALASPPAHADTVVVLDRGQGAQAARAEHAALALRLATAVAARGEPLRVMAVGARASGKPRVTDLRLPLDAAALQALDAREGAAFEGPSDARAALAAALRGSTPRDPVTLLLVGPFGRLDPAPEGTGFALETWNRTAPAGSRLVPLGLSVEALGALGTARGLLTRGVVVLALGPAQARAEPWSAFHDSVVLRAEVEVPVERVAFGEDPPERVPLEAEGGEGDSLTALPAGAGRLRWRLEHAQVKGLRAQVAFRVPADGAPASGPPAALLLLAPAPPPLEVLWAEVQPEVRWGTADGAPPRLEAEDLERGVARVLRARYRRTAGAAPTGWLTVVEREDPAAPEPPEVALAVEGETRLSPFVVEGEAVLTLTPGAWRAGRVAGRVLLEPQGPGAGAPLAVAYGGAYTAPRVRAALEGPPQPVKLPPSSGERPFALRVEAQNANAPPAVDLLWSSDLPGVSLLVERTASAAADGERLPLETVWRPQESLRVPVGATLTLRLRAPDRPGWTERDRGPRTLVLRPAEPGPVEVVCEGEVRYQARAPTWRVDPASGLYRADATEPEAERPLRAVFDADGGDGAWLAGELAEGPVLEQDAQAPQRFALVTTAPGRAEVRRAGPWQGPRGGIFEDREEVLAVRFPDARTEQRLRLVVPARWGRLGYALAGLAGLAALLGLLAWRAHRVEPAAGTLLYTVEGRAGAVGRLPLGPAGRRRTPVTVDGQGRLALGGSGPVLVRLLPTRVGSMLEVPVEGGGRGFERRLLVDGFSLVVGRHALRYVKGGSDAPPPPPTPGAVPDLLGPEYDLPSSQDGPADAGVGPSTGPEPGDAPPADPPPADPPQGGTPRA